MPPDLISAPIATSAPQAGTSNEIKASDSAKASTNTIGAAHCACRRTKSIVLLDDVVKMHRGSTGSALI